MPPDCMAARGAARVHIVNFHKFKLLETGDAGKFTTTILAGRKGDLADLFLYLDRNKPQ